MKKNATDSKEHSQERVFFSCHMMKAMLLTVKNTVKK